MAGERRVAVGVDDNICNLCLMTKFLTPIMLGFLMYSRWVAGWQAVGGSLECIDLSYMCHTNVFKPTRMILMIVI